MNQRELKFKEWSDGVAEIAVDALMHSGLVENKNFKEASAIVGEELFVRLILGDLPDVKIPLDAASAVADADSQNS